MEDKIIIKNRLSKNLKKLSKWLTSEKIYAYRLYDRDIPEYPYIIDIYYDVKAAQQNPTESPYAVIWEKGKNPELVGSDKTRRHQQDIFEALEDILNIPAKKVFLKERKVQKGKQQYAPSTKRQQTIVTKENGCDFLINLSDYLDTGLFLDHRPLRSFLLKKSMKQEKFLNLFCYTGAFSVIAVKAGAQVTSVDLSNTYLDWSKTNFALNNLDSGRHKFIKSDVFNFAKEDDIKYDTIVCDPPSFSNSKSVQGSFDVQRDHLGLIRLCMGRLKNDGSLYFSTNRRKFLLENEVSQNYKVKNITLKTIPRDFRDQKIHQCYEIKHS